MTDGRGVYRSSYLNARRLAATETNIAYRTADHERWQQMDFVVGIEIHLSNNHTCKGRDGKPHAFMDICDQLKGKYPKDFKFTGWHPHCRCYATSILKTDEETAEDTKKMLRGEPVTGESENAVDDVPEGFKDWMEKNEERIKGAKSLPYFVRENGGYLGVKLEGKEEKTTSISAETEQERSKDIHDLMDTSSHSIITKEKAKENIASIDEARRRYDSYDDEWEKVYFNEENGGYNVYHSSHQFSGNRAEKRALIDGREIIVKSKMTGGEAEKYVGRVLAEKKAKQIEFLPENGKGTGKPDTAFDDRTWDVKYIPLANVNTIRKYIEDARKADCAIFYWDEENQIEGLKLAVERTIGKFKKKGELESLPSVFYMNDEGELRCIFDNS